MNVLLSRTTLLKVFTGLLASVILFAGLNSQAAGSSFPKTKLLAQTQNKAKASEKAKISKKVPAKTSKLSKSAKFKKSAKVRGKSLRPSNKKATTSSVKLAQLEPVKVAQQPEQPTAELKANAGEHVAKKPWTVVIGLETATSFHKDGTYERKAITSVAIAPSYIFTNEWKVSASTMAYKEDVYPGNSGIDNTAITSAYSRALQNGMKWTSTAGVTLPTDANLRDETSYQGGARVGTGINFGELFLGSTASYKVGFSRSFHEFDQTAEGGFNVRENFSQTVDFSLPFNDKISFSTFFTYTVGRTYQDDDRHKFAIGADLGYQITKALSASIGTSNDGNALKPNGSDSNIQFFDENSSMMKIGLTYVL
jgi:hypothetical protein